MTPSPSRSCFTPCPCYPPSPPNSQDDNTFVHTVPPYPVRRPARPVPTFEEKEEQPPAHIPSFLPAFPDPHTFEHTPAFPGHELNPQKQTEVRIG